MKKVLVFALAAVLALSICACGGTDKPAETQAATEAATQAASEAATEAESKADVVIEPVELSCASFLADVAPNNKIPVEIMNKVNEILGGDYVTITVYPSGTLAGAAEMLDSLDSGVCDIGIVQSSIYPSRMPVVGLAEQPGLVFNSGEQVSAAVYDYVTTYEPAVKELEGYKVLAVLGASGGALYSHKQIHTVADVENVLCRCTNVTKPVLEAWKAVPVTLEWSECYEAMRNNLVDALYADSVTGKFSNIQEVAEYYTYLPLLNNNTFILLSDMAYDKLQPEVADALMEASAWVQENVVIPNFADNTLQLTDEYINGFKEITLLSDDKMEEFLKGQKPILDQYLKDLDAQGIDGQGALDAFNACLDKYAGKYDSEKITNHFKSTGKNIFIAE